MQFEARQGEEHQCGDSQPFFGTSPSSRIEPGKTPPISCVWLRQLRMQGLGGVTATAGVAGSHLAKHETSVGFLLCYDLEYWTDVKLLAIKEWFVKYVEIGRSWSRTSVTQ